jgi:HEAT repeat protein
MTVTQDLPSHHFIRVVLMTYRMVAAFLTATGMLLAQGRSAPARPSGTEATARTDAAWKVLGTGLEDSDPDHRKKALAAMGTIGTVPQAVEMVEKALKDKDTLVRQTAAATLGQMGSEVAIPSLRAALDDGPEVSFTAAKALWDLGDQTDSREIFEQVIAGERKDTPGKLQGALREAKHKLKPGELALMGAKEAAGLLGPASIGVTAAEEAIKDSKKGSGAPGRVIAAEILATDPDPYALTLLEWAVADDSSAVRVAVLKGLGERGNQETIPKLMPLLTDDRHAVRYMAAASIIKLSMK